MIDNVTCLILTFNEEPNIRRTLERLQWMKKIIVIDSYSTDDTVKISRSYPQVEIYQRKFDTFAGQCNFGLKQVTTEWVLSLDADYVLTAELIAEIRGLSIGLLYDGYFARFKYCVFGKPLRGTLYPPRQVLYRKAKARYVDDGHGHRVKVDGKSGILTGHIYHDDRKPLGRWLQSQDKYMIIETQKLLATPLVELNIADRIRKQKVFAPFFILFYCLILKQGLLDGWPGWYYAFQRMLAEMILSIRLIEFEHLPKQDLNVTLMSKHPSPPILEP